jgi:orotate phosphoribosyltransferase
MERFNLEPIDLSTEELTDKEFSRFADLLFEIGAIKFGAFRLKLHETQPDAPLSPLYVNLRILRSHPQVLGYVTRLLDKLTCRLPFDLMADIPTAITPVVSVLSFTTERPMISPRQTAKGYGLGVQIDGTFEAGQTVLLIDDVLSKGDSKLEAIAKLEEAGLKVAHVVTVVDREQGGAEMLTAKGYNFISVASISRLLEHYHASGKIESIKYTEVKDYLADQTQG